MSQAVGRVQRSTVELVRRYVDVCEIEISLRFLRARRSGRSAPPRYRLPPETDDDVHPRSPRNAAKGKRALREHAALAHIALVGDRARRLFGQSKESRGVVKEQFPGVGQRAVA